MTVIAAAIEPDGTTAIAADQLHRPSGSHVEPVWRVAIA